jgi:hypothetical protein
MRLPLFIAGLCAALLVVAGLSLAQGAPAGTVALRVLGTLLGAQPLYVAFVILAAWSRRADRPQPPQPKAERAPPHAPAPRSARIGEGL